MLAKIKFYGGTMEQKQLTQFTFYDLYWDLIKQSDDGAAGRLIRNICKYMFTDEPITEPQDDKENYFGVISLTCSTRTSSAN